jgi:hypothetical protein
VWFPGRSVSATAHWWVGEGSTVLIGDVYGLADSEAYQVYRQLTEDKRLPWVFADCDWNTFMALPSQFEANVIPYFARSTADWSYCCGIKSERAAEREASLSWIRDPDRHSTNWRISERVARESEPEEFLDRLLIALRHA